MNRPQGALNVGGNIEVQTSSEGREFALLLVFEYGVADRLQLLIEPVATSRIGPEVGPQAHGVGDTEVTALCLMP